MPKLTLCEDARPLLGIPPNYGFIWQQLQNIEFIQGPLPLQTGEHLWIHWRLNRQTT